MDSNELLVKATRKFVKEDLESILEDLYTSKDLSMSKLSSIITKGKTKVTKVNITDAKKVLETIVPYSIIKYDIQHAMELAGIDNEEIFKARVLRDKTCDPKDIKNYKNGIYEGINGKPGVFYKGKGNKTYAILSSTELYPNNDKFKDDGNSNHQFVINATGNDYMEVVSQLIESFLNDGIPFNIVVRLPKDMKDGYPDPIRLYCTDKNLQATLDEVERMTYVLKDKLEAPDWRITASINGLYGYTQIDVKNGNKTPMDRIFDTVTKVIDQDLTEYDKLNNNPVVSEYTWPIRVTKLLRMKALDNDRYEQFLNNCMNYISELGIDLNDVYKVQTVKNIDQDIRDMDVMLSAIDGLLYQGPKVETKAEIQEEVQEDKTIDSALYDQLQGTLDKARETGIVDNMPVVPGVMPEKEVEPPYELPPVGPIVDEKASYEQLANVLSQVRDKVQTNEYVVDDHNWSNITNAPVDEPIPTVQEEVKEEHDKLEETQAYTPITDEMVLGNNEPKKNTPPVLPDDVKEVDPDSVDEDEFVSLDTGSYKAIPVEVTGFDNDEVKSIVNAAPAGQAMSMQDAVVALNEYEGLITANEAVQNVVNSNGESVSLIDYLKYEEVSKKVPFDSVVVLNDGSEITGKDFIKNYVIPVVKQNTQDNIVSVDQIVNNYSTQLRTAEPVKKGFFARLFHK